MSMDYDQPYDENFKAFVQRLVDAGWRYEDAVAEWESIQDDEEGGL